MEIAVGIRLEYPITKIGEVSINNSEPRLFGSISDSTLRSLESIIDEVTQTPVEKVFTFDTDKIVQVASEYFIIHEPDLHSYTESGVKVIAGGMYRTPVTHVRVREKGDPVTVVHELIHIKYDHEEDTVGIGLDPTKHKALDLASLVIVSYHPQVILDIQRVQVKKVLKAVKEHFPELVGNLEKYTEQQYQFESMNPKKREECELTYEGFLAKAVFQTYYETELRAALQNERPPPAK